MLHEHEEMARVVVVLDGCPQVRLQHGAGGEPTRPLAAATIQYNDTFGRPAGDKAIASVAQTVASYLKRSTDFLARYGGEEFVALSLDNSSQQIFEHLKNIRQAVENLRIPHDPSVAQWVTVSVGGVTIVPDEESAYDFYLEEALIKCACAILREFCAIILLRFLEINK